MLSTAIERQPVYGFFFCLLLVYFKGFLIITNYHLPFCDEFCKIIQAYSFTLPYLLMFWMFGCSSFASVLQWRQTPSASNMSPFMSTWHFWHCLRKVPSLFSDILNVNLVNSALGFTVVNGNVENLYQLKNNSYFGHSSYIHFNR